MQTKLKQIELLEKLQKYKDAKKQKLQAKSAAQNSKIQKYDSKNKLSVRKQCNKTPAQNSGTFSRKSEMDSSVRKLVSSRRTTIGTNMKQELNIRPTSASGKSSFSTKRDYSRRASLGLKKATGTKTQLSSSRTQSTGKSQSIHHNNNENVVRKRIFKTPVAERRSTLGHKSFALNNSGRLERRKTVGHRASPRHTTGYRTTGQYGRAPLVDTKQFSRPRGKTVTKKLKSALTSSAVKMTVPSPVTRLDTPNRKRSFTVSPEKVASPGIKRPIVLDSGSLCNSAKRRKTEVTAPSTKSAGRVTQVTNTSKQSQTSLREKLLEWRQCKNQPAAVPTSGTTSKPQQRVPSTLGKPSKVTDTESRRKSTFTGISQPDKVLTAVERRKLYAAQIRSQSSSRASCVDRKPAITARSASSGPPRRNTAAVTRRPSISVSQTETRRGQINAPPVKTRTVPTTRRQSCVVPSTGANKADALNRRKSYAMSLQSRFASAPETRKSLAIKRLSVQKAKSPQSVTAKITQRSKQGSDVTPLHVSQNTKTAKQVAVISPSSVTPVSEVQSPIKDEPIPEDSNEVTKTVVDSGVSEDTTIASVSIGLSEAEVKALDYSPTQVFSPVPFKTPRNKNRRSVRFLTPQSEARLRPEINTPVTPVQCSRLTPALSTPRGLPRMTPLQKELSMREKLNNWLKTHGKTPTRYKHLLCFGDICDEDGVELKNKPGGLSIHQLARQQETLLDEEFPEAASSSATPDDSVADRLEEVLSECIILLESDCPAETVSQWLDQICANLQGAKQRAKYWICKAKIAEQTGNDGAVITVFEESVRHSAQPPEEVADALKDFVEQMTSKSYLAPNLDIPIVGTEPFVHTPRKRAREIQQENIITASAVKYCYTDTTPFFTRLRSRARRSYHTPRAKVTPVRRSARLSANTDLPDMLRDHDLILDSLDCLPEEHRQTALYAPNRALTAELEAALDDSY